LHHSAECIIERTSGFVARGELQHQEEEMEFSGERYVPELHGNIELEHLHRYLQACEFATGKIVLDIASGEGYGSAMLANKADKVIGVDISNEIVQHARKRYGKENLDFIVGSCAEIPLPDASVDLVVSFETLEHHDQHERMMQEIKRVLLPTGMLIVSTPDKYYYSVKPGYSNPYHVKELYQDEFKKLLGNYFKYIAHFGQRIVYGSNIFPELLLTPALSYLQESGTITAASGVIRPTYMIALASDIELPETAASVLEQPITESEIVRSWSKVVTDRDQSLLELAQQLNATQAELVSLLELAQQLNATQAQLTQVTSSISWKITLPLRTAKRWLKSLVSEAKRHLRGGAKIAKTVYLSLPMSPSTIGAHRLFLSRHVPGILRASKGLPFSAPMVPQVKATTRPIRDLGLVATTINLTTSLQPIVSVIIPFYGKCDYTIRCLASIAAYPPSIPFEVIVVDDGSPDNSAEVLLRVNGIQVISNPENQGFIRSCNIGAKSAIGQYLHFLNNDTEVTPGWLDELIRTFHEFPGTGLTGSKLVYPDGSLQEAGGIIWRDGTAWNFGRNQDQLLPIYNYAREVDFCSGASIMVPKSLFEELGGFDEYYLPAYCEDSDLALKIRDRGYRVIYQPLSVVVHYEGVTSGTDVTQGIKAYQIENLRKQFRRWEKRLASHEALGQDIDGAKDRMARRRVLVVDHNTPTPNQDAGSVITINLLLLLREMDFQVTFIPEDNFMYMPDYTPALQRVGIEVLYAPYCTSVEQHLKESGGRYDLVFIFRPGVVERYIKTIRKHCPRAKVLFHTVDLHYLRMSREAELLQDKVKMKAANKMKRREFAAIRAADTSIVVSTTELELLHHELPNERIRVFPLIMDIRGTEKAFKDRRDVIFVGGYQHTPNIDAVQYFVSDVMPILRRRLPGIRFHGVGSKMPAEIRALASEDVIIPGFVDDLSSLLDRMRVSVAPLRYGAGIKGKIGTAMAVGLPSVATSLAVEGMSLTDGENILVSDDAADFADAVTRLHEDEELWNKLSKAGLDFAKKIWGAEAAWETLDSILREIGISSVRGSHPLTLYSPRSEPATFSRRTFGPQPIAAVRNKEEFEQVLSLDIFKKIKSIENDLIDSANAEHFSVEGFCIPCNKRVHLLVDMKSGGQRIGYCWIPNWRERLECPSCHMNNRQRLIATLVKQRLGSQDSDMTKIYFMEQVTPIFQWAVAAFPQHKIVGSEYLGDKYPSGSVIKGIRHEDAMNLSFEDNSIDLIVSNEVFEHIPVPKKAFSECVRTLRPGGILLATFPFHQNMDLSVARAKINVNGLENLLPPQHHGNPVSADGSLVYTDFGWDVLDDLRAAGFTEIGIEIYVSAEYGHLGSGLLVFVAKK
jgi:O-antigen biosynthesis protein